MLHISDSLERPEAGLPHVVIWRPLQVGLTNLTSKILAAAAKVRTANL